MLTTVTKNYPTTMTPVSTLESIDQAISKSWSVIAPFWPLKNLIAVNPVGGFEQLKFENALHHAMAYFQQPDLPAEMQQVNRLSIKWLQVFFDEGQATIQMPLRSRGLLRSTLSLFPFDEQLHQNNNKKTAWLEQLPQRSNTLIAYTLSYLGIEAKEQETFLTLLLTTLPGWAAHIQYRSNWADAQDANHPHPVTQADYLAFRLVITCLIWPEAKHLLQWHRNASSKANSSAVYKSVVHHEQVYQRNLLQQLMGVHPPMLNKRFKAQLVFCIDVRSEPFRRALEAQGSYETYGFAGFFGVPVSIENAITGESYASCPVLLKPACSVKERAAHSSSVYINGASRLTGVKKLYQSLKYTFTTPFSLVEAMGWAAGLWMSIRTAAPRFAASIEATLNRAIAPTCTVLPDISSMPHHQQVTFAAGALKMMGLTQKFAPLVIFCGHGSETTNNAYATALDCGACGGRHGAPNARILATILNKESIRKALEEQHINIPEGTVFLAAEHCTTTDEVTLFHQQLPDELNKQLQVLKNDLVTAGNLNSFRRITALGSQAAGKKPGRQTFVRAKDWAEVRPEWGLAGNAAFIVGPRWLTKNLDLEGKSFLHSYEWEQDRDGSLLTAILTAPMVVAQWINAQYFFSTLDNVAFGGGSKVTKNITGKIGVMQGNASDLMHGLPLQSVFKTDTEAYHQLMRLTVVVYAPKSRVNQIVQDQPILQKLFGNGWVHLICYDPQEETLFQIAEDLIWITLKIKSKI